MPNYYGTSTPKKGDGFCDGINNNAACDWDGGDCCPTRNPNCLDNENNFCPCRYAWNIHCLDPLSDECKCLDPNNDADSCYDDSGK